MFSRRQVSVQVGARPKKVVAEVRPRLVIVAVIAFDSPWVIDTYPGARVADSRYAPHRLGVEHLRFVPGQEVGALPGLDGPQPSLLRDAVALALGSGCPSVDVLLAHVQGAKPWELCDPGAEDLLKRALGEVPGTVVVFPDAAGPPDTPLANLDGLVRTVRTYGRTLSDHFQLGVFDLPADMQSSWPDTLRRIRFHDVCLASWTGDDHVLEQHGWRCGAAWLGGRIAAAETPMDSVVGQTFDLPGGRSVVRGRQRWLGKHPVQAWLPRFAAAAVSELRVERGRVTIGGEPTLRDPVGMWDVPLLRTSKVLHQRIVITANLFVFREATAANALLLQTALQMALADFVRRDILGGPDAGRPQIHCVPDKNPGQPALVATVVAFLKPWVREMRLEVAVRPGDAVVLEVI